MSEDDTDIDEASATALAQIPHHVCLSPWNCQCGREPIALYG